MPRNKYKKGHLVFSLDELSSGLDKGQWYYLKDKVLHPGFFYNMNFRTITVAIANRMIREAINQRHKDYKDYKERLSKYAVDTRAYLIPGKETKQEVYHADGA